MSSPQTAEPRAVELADLQRYIPSIRYAQGVLYSLSREALARCEITSHDQHRRCADELADLGQTIVGPLSEGR